MTRDSMNDFLCGIESWTLREDEPTPQPEPSIVSAQTNTTDQQPGPAALGFAFRRVVQTETLPSVRGGNVDLNRQAGSSPDTSSPSSSDTASEERVEVGPSRRTYTRPWSANMATTTTEARAVRRARPSSARTSNLEATRGQQKKNPGDKAAVKKKTQQRQRKREQGWDTRFTVAGSDSTMGAASTQFRKTSTQPRAMSQPKTRPVSFSLGKEQQKHSSNRGVHGKLLPWLDPKKQIKRKPLVGSGPYMLPKRNLVVA